MLTIRENMSYWISELSSKSGVLRALLSIVDILMLSLLLYVCVKFLMSIMSKRSGRILVGVAAVLLLTMFSYLLNLRATFYVLETVMQFGLIAIVIIFQPEIRTILENVGGIRIIGGEHLVDEDKQPGIISSVCAAIGSMSKHYVGALIIFQRKKELNSYNEKNAVVLNSDISKELIENIFFKNSPLHDGAVVIKNFRLDRARVLFNEISNNQDLALDLGSRHKAGVGATENGNDCIAVIVSEETGQISYAIDGELKQNVSTTELYNLLTDMLTDPAEEKMRLKKGKSKEKTVINK